MIKIHHKSFEIKCELVQVYNLKVFKVTSKISKMCASANIISACSSNNDTDSDDDRDEHTTPVKQSRKPIIRANRPKKFQEVWLNDGRFKQWLLPVRDTAYKAYCKACKTNLVCGASELNKHNQSKSHKINFVNMQHTRPINLFLGSSSNHKKSVKYAELKLASFFAEHNVSLHVIDHLSPLLKQIAPDSKIVGDIHLGRTKISNILSQVLAKAEDHDLVTFLQNNSFSIFLDESTDIANLKNICILARYVNNFKVITQLLELINIDAVNCSAIKIFEKIKFCFEKRNINMNNIISMASDNASVMIGENNSVFTLLQQEIGNHHEVILLKCICHSSALVLKSAMTKIPERIEKFIRNCGSYMSESPKSCAVLKEFQDYFEVAQIKISSIAPTRWLSMHPCIVKILDNWLVLKHFFVHDATFTHRKKAQNILQEFENVQTKAYLLFLKNIIVYFNRFNALFQSETVLIHKLYEESKNILVIIARYILKPEIVQLISTGNFLNYVELTNANNILHINEIEFDAEFTEYINEYLVEEQRIEVKSNCAKFVQICIEKIVDKFPINNIFFKTVEFLNPQVALYVTNRNASKTLKEISKFVKCNTYELEDEWKDIPFQYSDAEKQMLVKLDVAEFWKIIGTRKALNGELLFPNLIKLVKFTLSLPHSNADAERIFSMVTDIKSKKRNRLGEETLNALCVFKSALKGQDKNCLSFEPEERHYSLCGYKNLYA